MVTASAKLLAEKNETRMRNCIHTMVNRVAIGVPVPI
jgi:hypothetical protein